MSSLGVSTLLAASLAALAACDRSTPAAGAAKAGSADVGAASLPMTSAAAAPASGAPDGDAGRGSDASQAADASDVGDASRAADVSHLGDASADASRPSAATSAAPGPRLPCGPKTCGAAELCLREFGHHRGETWRCAREQPSGCSETGPRRFTCIRPVGEY